MIIVIYQDVHRYGKPETKTFLTTNDAGRWLQDANKDICPDGESVEYVMVEGMILNSGIIDNT